MKKTAILLSFLLVVAFTYAQDDYQSDEIQTIFLKLTKMHLKDLILG